MISLLALESAMEAKSQTERVEDGIHLIRGQRVMLDSDLAVIYGVETRKLNQQFRRNRSRFPNDFAFQLTALEFANLKLQIATSSDGLRSKSVTSNEANLISQSVTSSSHGGRRKLPWAFTEHGAIMLASVLNSPIAVEASVRVVRAFVRLREMISANAVLAGKIDEIERRLDSSDASIARLFAALRQLIEPPLQPKREIGFHVRERSPRYGAKKEPSRSSISALT